MDPKCKELHFDEPNIKLVVGAGKGIEVIRQN